MPTVGEEEKLEADKEERVMIPERIKRRRISSQIRSRKKESGSRKQI